MYYTLQEKNKKVFFIPDVDTGKDRVNTLKIRE